MPIKGEFVSRVRHIVRQTSFAALAIYCGRNLSACASQNLATVIDRSPKAFVTPVIVPTTLQTQLCTLQDYPAVLEKSGGQRKETRAFILTQDTQHIGITVNNFTNSPLNMAIVKEMYQFIASAYGEVLLNQGSNPNNTLAYVIDPAITSSSLTIVNPYATAPGCTTLSSDHAGVTDKETTHTYSVVQAGASSIDTFNTSIAMGTTLSSAIEICQELITAGQLSGKNRFIPNQDYQELTCNSLGLLTAALVENLNYSQYTALANSVIVSTNGGDLSAFIVSAQDYKKFQKQFPLKGSVLRTSSSQNKRSVNKNETARRQRKLTAAEKQAYSAATVRSNQFPYRRTQ